MNLDFTPTMLDVAGVDVPEGMQGHSLRPLMSGRTPDDWRDSVYYHYYEFPGAHSVAKHYGVRTRTHKLIHFYDVGTWELFDLEKDPQEMQSVYDDPAYAGVRGELEAELKRLQDQYHDDGTVIGVQGVPGRAPKPGQPIVNPFKRQKEAKKKRLWDAPRVPDRYNLSKCTPSLHFDLRLGRPGCMGTRFSSVPNFDTDSKFFRSGRKRSAELGFEFGGGKFWQIWQKKGIELVVVTVFRLRR